MVTEMIDAAFEKAVQHSGLPNAIAIKFQPKLHALACKEISGTDVAGMLIELCEGDGLDTKTYRFADLAAGCQRQLKADQKCQNKNTLDV